MKMLLPGSTGKPFLSTSLGLSEQRKEQLWLLIFILCAAIRVACCFNTPMLSGDIYRNLMTGKLVVDHGLDALSMPLTQAYPWITTVVPWAEIPYNYPPFAVFFWTACAWIHSSVLFAKLVLTGIEVINSLLVRHMTGSRVWGLVYWCLPGSVYWASNDGQFEPVQNLCILGALCLIRARPVWAGAALAAGIQVKVMAVLFLPYLVYRAWSEGSWKTLSFFTLGLALGALPGIYCFLHYPVLKQFLLTLKVPITFNPHHWAFWQHGHWVLPLKNQIILQFAGLSLLVITLMQMGSRSLKSLSEACAMIGFLAASRIMGVFGWWYFMLVIPCMMPLQLQKRRSSWFPIIIYGCLICVDPISFNKIFHRDWEPPPTSSPIDVHLPIDEALPKRPTIK